MSTTDIIPRTTVTEICAHRDQAMATMRRALDLMTEAGKLAELAQSQAQLAHGAAAFTLHDRSQSEAYRRLFTELNPDRSWDAWRQQTDARVWIHLLTLSGMFQAMDATAKEELDQQLLQSVPEVTEQTVRDTFAGLREDAGLIFSRGLARAFSGLDRRFKSHDGFKLGSRIILTHVFDSWGHWSMGSRTRDTLLDVERVFRVLDGAPSAEAQGQPSLIELIDRDRGRGWEARQSTTTSPYFKIRVFQNGNAHLWFTRDDLVERANQMLADYYGQVLPDAAPAPTATSRSARGADPTALSKDLAFYPTPPQVVNTLLERLSLGEDSLVLEPSAGEGAFVRALLAKGARVTAIEVDPGRCQTLRRREAMHPRLTVVQANFLTYPPTPTYTHVVMNPPFEGTHYMHHVRKAWEMLQPGGLLVSILPASVEFGETRTHEEFRQWLVGRKDGWALFHDLPPESFKASGTRINTCYVILRKPAR